MLREISRTAGVACAVFFALVVFAVISRLGGEGAGATIVRYPGITRTDAGTAIIFLLPISIALQILLRLPRDPDQLKPDEATAQRQFWGSVAALVSAGSAFVALCAFVDGFIATVHDEVLDLNRLLGVPLGSVVALVIAADAAATAQREGRLLNLDSAYREEQINALEAAAKRATGDSSERPRRRLIIWLGLAVVVSVGVASAVVWFLLRDGRATALFGIIVLIVTFFSAFVLPHAGTDLLRGKLLEIIGQALQPVMVLLVFALQLTGFALSLIPEADQGQPSAYIPAIAYGVLAFLPVILATIMVAAHHPWSRLAPPLFDYAGSALLESARRLREKEPQSRERDTWEVFAWAAILTSMLPAIPLLLALAAKVHRADSPRRRRHLFAAMWVFPIVIAALEVIALLLFPLYATSLGWMTFP
ncbi:hypothetical protein ACUOFU_05095 [Microbacterium arabinogalactanolyticum]|uniref:hypothetical protein n=1 Tax=Microbacterium arabinogalactanolyticum TaxID=69365 RepID=UPI004043BBBD